jgi:heterodisulfide reductase subunit B
MYPVQTLLYYPGCSIKRDFIVVERTSKAVLEALGYKLVEINNWYCCGGFPGVTQSEHSKYVSSLRTLTMAQMQARELGTDTVVTLCPFCYNTLKQGEQLRSIKPDLYTRVASYLRDEFTPYQGGLRVVHFVELLYSKLSDLAKLAEGRLKGIKVAPYYGCMLLRPKSIALDNPDNPEIIERILRPLGAEPVKYPYRTYCCGSFHTLGEPEIVKRNTSKIASSITSSGASITVTPCPLCLYNLRVNTNLRVLHLSEIVAYALNLRDFLDEESFKILSTLRGEI